MANLTVYFIVFQITTLIKSNHGKSYNYPLFAGTRKLDNTQVAIKEVPKNKVKRWGKLNGRVVPIEFDLLHRATSTGHKGKDY